MSLKTEKLYRNMYNYFVNVSGLAQGRESTSVSFSATNPLADVGGL